MVVPRWKDLPGRSRNRAERGCLSFNRGWGGGGPLALPIPSRQSPFPFATHSLTDFVSHFAVRPKSFLPDQQFERARVRRALPTPPSSPPTRRRLYPRPSWHGSRAIDATLNMISKGQSVRDTRPKFLKNKGHGLGSPKK